MQSQPWWFLRNIYAWIVLGLSLITAVIIGEFWVVLVGVIGYELALLVELTRGRSLGRTGAVRLARAEQENRELKAEQARLLGAIQDQAAQLAEAEGRSLDQVEEVEDGQESGGA
jgi:hypothetical protein